MPAHRLRAAHATPVATLTVVYLTVPGARALPEVDGVHVDVRGPDLGGYGLASMHLVAEGATEDYAEFADFCRAFVRCVGPGGHLVAAFMENMPTWRIGPASVRPGRPVDPEPSPRSSPGAP